ncbi:hypothetical protein JMJ35_007720 [Cladonia borealis]|uniref:Ankyrin repeat protein n=1 Tax=Cladonia borealis TaxID=184061 RepID=A0AA39U8F5_9LECA|nr:hypothetical protein JMJ35_007720 [Cladonia borealis]
MAECPEALGLKVLVEGSNPCVDIVAVHGLGATPDWAWIRKVEDGNKEVHVNWLMDQDMLPAKLPNSRIMTFNYESKWLLAAPKQRRSLCAIQLLTALDNKRKEEKDTQHRPLIFIGHSFGGVVIEQSLVSANSHKGSFEHLALSTVGIVFLGTPHRGTKAAKWGSVVATSAKALGFGTEDKSSRDLLYEFTLWANRASLTLICFFEQHRTDYGKRYGVKWEDLVVDETSACIDGYRKVPLPTDHFKINKFSGPDDPAYNAVYPLVMDMAQKAIRVVQGRLNPQKIIEDNSMIPEKNLDCLRSLFLSNPQDDLAAIRTAKGNRVDGTCEWILTQDSYTSWLIEDSPQLLWLSGAPGIGKTMISSFLVEELARLAERSSQITLAYYFCDDKDVKRKTATDILRGLLLQLLRQRPILFKHIQPDFDMSRDSLFTNFHSLWRIFHGIVKDPEAGEVICLVDALDECEKESRQLFLTEFTKLFDSQQSSKRVVKSIITSRRENDIVESLTAASPAIRNIQVDTGRVNDDLSKFINVKVDELSNRKRYQAKQKDIIKRSLTEKAGGTFLYVSLVLQDLQKAKIFSQVKQKLQGLPLDLNDVYDRILGQIDADCKETAKLVLRWVAVARRPLTVDELAVARALGTEEYEENTMPPKDLLDELKDSFKCCEPLVYVDPENDTVNLVHQSAKDYLLSTYLQGKDGLSQYQIATDWTNFLIFQTCWTYLSLEEFKQGTVIIERCEDHTLRVQKLDKQFLYNHGFLQYASKEWQEHALAASQVLITGYEFRTDNLDKLPTLRDTWLIRAAAEGQEVVVQRLLDNGAELNSKDELGRTPLSYAAENGHEAVVKLLLSYDVAADSQDTRYGQTPLSWAAENGREVVVKLLLSYDVAADSQSKYGRTPLSWAAENGHEAVVKLLLSRDDVAADSQDTRYGHTPLSRAAENGHEAVVKLLLSRDDVAADSQDKSFGQTPLSWAAENGHEAVVKLLKQKIRDASNTTGN